MLTLQNSLTKVIGTFVNWLLKEDGKPSVGRKSETKRNNIIETCKYIFISGWGKFYSHIILQRQMCMGLTIGFGDFVYKQHPWKFSYQLGPR